MKTDEPLVLTKFKPDSTYDVQIYRRPVSGADKPVQLGRWSNQRSAELMSDYVVHCISGSRTTNTC